MSRSPQLVTITPPSAPKTDPPRRSWVLRAGGLAGGAVVTAWLLSVTYHVVVFVIMFYRPWLVGIFQASTDAPPPFTSIVGDVDQPKVTLAPSNPVAASVAPNAIEPLKFQPVQAPGPSNFAPGPSGFASKTRGGLSVLGVGRSDATGLSDGPSILGIGTGGGEFDKYGFSVAPGSGGPQFFGLGGQARGARNIAYVVDRSGSMLTTIAGVKKELRDSISKLRRSQKFHVIFFNAGAPLENPPRRMVSAINAHKQDAFAFIESIAANDGTDPRPAMRRAFAVEPDVVYFLTDGEFDPALVEVLDQLNRDRKVRIFTIAYVSRTGAPLLERIAREHNGEYRFVSEDEIFQ